MSKVIITCAVTGAAHTPTMSPHLPYTIEDISNQSIEAVKAGAAIVHLHARDPENGEPSFSPDLFREYMQRIAGATDAVINLSTGGGMLMTVEQRTLAARTLKPEMCSLNMGSLNFGAYEALAKFKDFRFDWERPYLEASKGTVFKNTFADIEWILEHVGEAAGVKFEYECYDTGHLYNLASYLDKGMVKGPLFIQTVFGFKGGTGADPEDLMHQKRTADRLFGKDYLWSVLPIGRHQMRLNPIAALLGGNVRVGLEDSLLISRGQLAQSNAEQVRKIRRILEDMGMEIATPDEARAMLQLKGASQVAI